MTTAANPRSDGFWSRLRERFAATGDAGGVLGARTALAEELVRAAHEKHLAPRFPEGLAVLAVGGFGRRELFPHSDVDLLVLVERQPAREEERSALRGFLQELWDSGARVSHSVRTPAECCELREDNIELSVSLLDQRPLAGDMALHAKFSAALARFFHGQRQSLTRHVCRMARARHAKHNNLIFQLEPNLKEAPGGLRDCQLLCWLGQLRNTHPDRLPTAAPPAELEAARDFLFSVRCYLHFQAERDSNVLTFDLQEEILQQPGLFAANPAAWMREYYRHVRQIHRGAVRAIEASEEQSSALLLQFRDWRSRVSNAEFFVSRERVFFRAPAQLARDPDLALRLFQFVARHGLRLAQETERRLEEQLPGLRHHFAESHPLWPALSELFLLPGAALALRAMQETGVLAAVFPEWERIECLVVRDFHHRYTVDEHSLVTLETLAELRSSEEPVRQPFRDLLSELGDFDALTLALLFHDLGKASRGADHVGESALLAEGAMERMQAPPEVRRAVTLLIGGHLELSAVINSRDLSDPATARLVAERTGTIENLKALTLLTYADISAVNPAAMTPWRAEQLWRLYVVAYQELTRELETARIDRPTPDSPEQAAFLDGLPVRYLRTHGEAEIAAHVELERRSRAHGVALDIARVTAGYRLTLVTQDRPFLLASIAGALAGFGLNILKAEGFGNRHGTVLDTFVFSDPHRTLELNPPEMERLRVMLERVAHGKVDVKSLLRNRPKPAVPSRRTRIRPSVSFDNEASAAATLIHVLAEDRPGLLYDLATALSTAACSIELVLIDTEAHKALDVFYVTSGGGKLDAGQQAKLGEQLLQIARPA